MTIIESRKLTPVDGFDLRELIITASRAGVDLGTASLSGTDHGYIAPGCYSDPLRDSRITDYGLVDEAVAEARAKLAELLDGAS